jgi:hypothetical protein
VSKKQKLTPWFPRDVAPVRSGVYMVRAWSNAVMYSLWERGVWHGTTHDLNKAVAFGRRFGSTTMHLTGWRGLAEQPK